MSRYENNMETEHLNHSHSISYATLFVLTALDVARSLIVKIAYVELIPGLGEGGGQKVAGRYAMIHSESKRVANNSLNDSQPQSVWITSIC